VDLCCLERRMVVELDGGQHALQRETDAKRTAFLAWVSGLTLLG
jgi:very-short-patch-repair endonuclease